MTEAAITMHKPQSAWTAAEHHRYMRDGTKPLDPTYLQARHSALEQAGLPDEPQSTPLADLDNEQLAGLTAEEHFQRLQEGR